MCHSCLQGAIVYHDGQFNDSRLAIMLACTAAAAGATVLNHAEAVKLIKASYWPAYQLV